MNRFISMIAAAAVLAAALPAGAGDLMSVSGAHGYRQKTGAAGMAYFSLPFHAGRGEAKRPRLGFAMTAPHYGMARYFRLHTDAPKLVDFSFSGKDFASPWDASLSVGSALAWSSDPRNLPQGAGAHLLDDGGISWVAVGLAAAGIFVGTLLIIEDDVPPATGGQQ